MTLHCTLVGGPGSRLGGGQLELTIEAPPGVEGCIIQDRLAQAFRTGRVTVDGEDLRTVQLGTPPLVNGAVLVDAGSDPVRRNRQRVRPGETAPLLLAVHSGPAAGTLLALRRGSYTLGRKNCTLTIADAELSRQHARIVVTDTRILLEDLDSANGTFVDDARTRIAAITTRSTIRCGNSTMSLVFADTAPTDLGGAGAPVIEPITVPGGAEPGSRAALAAAALLPLAAGVGLAVVTGMWMFLAFSAASALALLIPGLSGRRRRKETAAAVRDAVDRDRRRRQASAPPLSSLALAARRASAGFSASPAGDGVWLRLGRADQPANVRAAAGKEVAVPSVRAAPVIIDAGRPRTAFHGCASLLDGMLRSIIMQLAGYPRHRTMRIIIHGPAETLPLSARYLPSVAMTTSAEACRRLLEQDPAAGCRRGILLLLNLQDNAQAGLSLAGVAGNHGWHVITFQPAVAGGPETGVGLFEHSSFLREPDRDLAFAPDLATVEVFNAFCRRMAAAGGGAVPGRRAVPDSCGLDELLPLSAAQTAARWDANSQRDGLAVPLGLSAAGSRTLDLQKDGPHLLVAGTTGSGKSELLRSLALSLALSHSPERVNLFFVDFKGGSGLGPLTGLVHCVGMLTDLEAYGLERTLASLRAEVRFREETLAAARVPDLAAYRSAQTSGRPALPHLVVIIDEFRMLVDDAPEVLRELMRIAAIGRSLGLHLVMATQRPQGALTADIRANVTSSIALRVQSDLESTDIIGSKLAAGISVDAPGRAYLVRGTGAPEEFQAASSCFSRFGQTEGGTVAVHLATDYVGSCVVGGPGEAQTPAQAAAPLVDVVRDAWSAGGGALPRRPVAAPLPHDIVEPSGDGGAGEHDDQAPTWSAALGLMDSPAAQRVEPLVWDPEGAGHLALIGAAMSGLSEVLQLAIRRLLAHRHPFHCYILDGTGHLQPLAAHPRVGAHAGLHELRRAVRILERLVHELAVRTGSRGNPATSLVVVISGWGSWASAFRSGPLAWAEDLIQDLIRDGAVAGITVLISGDRELATARFSGALPNRVYFPAGSTVESRVAWPRFPSLPAVKGRAVAAGPIAGGETAVCQLYRAAEANPWLAAEITGNPSRVPVPPPFRVEPLPARITAEEVLALSAPPECQAEPEGIRAGGGGLDVTVGVGGDELRPVSVRLRAGVVMAVLGTPGSGKTNTLLALQALNPARNWLLPAAGSSGGTTWTEALAKARSGRLPADTVLLVDDADLLPPSTVQHLTELHGLGHAVVLAATFSPLLLQRLPLMLGARTGGTALLLCPRSVTDGDLFGVRFEVEPGAPPGRAVLVSDGCGRPVQVGLVPQPPRADPAGPVYRAGGALPVRDA